MSDDEIIREKLASIQEKLKGCEKPTSSQSGAFQAINTDIVVLQHLIAERKGIKRLFPRTSGAEKGTLALLHVAIIVLLAILYQVYDNHKDINGNVNKIMHCIQGK